MAGAHRPRLVLVSMTLLAVQCLAEGAAVSQVCAVKPSFVSPFVTPFWEDNVPVVGCNSRSLAHRSQEVHVIYLKNDQEPSRARRVSVVTLHVKPLAEQSVHAGRLIIILHAQRNVSWRVVGERISNASHHTIVVTGSSEIIENNIPVVVMHRNEKAVSRVITWVTRRFKAITSFAEMGESNKVYLKVGVSDKAPRECNMKSGTVSSNVEAVLAQTVPTDQQEGCVVENSRAAQRPDMHVIYVHDVKPTTESTPMPTDDSYKTPTPVMLVVRSRSVRALDKNIILFLKAQQPVVWLIRSDDVQGVLRIVTEDPVERLHVPATHVIHVKTEELPENADDLLFYADNKHGPLRSYLEVKKANKFQLLLDEDGIDETVNTTPPEAKVPRQILWPPAPTLTTPSSIPSSKDFIKAQLGSIRNSKVTGVQVLMKSRGRISPEDLIRMPNVLLMDAMQVDCMPQYIQISFPRLTLERLGINGRDMSLNNPVCRVLANETHFVLSTYFKDCGTQMQHSGDRVVYKNAVNFHFLSRKVASGTSSMTIFKESDLLVDDEDHNLENGSGVDQDMWKKKEDDTNDDEDDGDDDGEDGYLRAKTLEFQCKYLASGLPINEKEPGPFANMNQRSNVTSPHWQIYGLDIYRDSEYRNIFKSTDYPSSVMDSDRLYVESRIDAGPRLRVVTEECWLSSSPNGSSTDHSRTWLIRNTCPADLSVHVQRAGPPQLGVRQSAGSGGLTSPTMRQWNRFNFQVNLKMEPVYLHCKLGVCSINPQHLAGNVKQCVDVEDYCLTNSFRSFLDQTVGTHHEILTRGPIHINPKPFIDKSFQTALLSSLAPFLAREKKTESHGISSPLDRVDEKILIQEPQVIMIGLSTEAVVGIAFASFLIGAALTAILWFIHMRTDPLRNGRARANAAHHSGYDLSAHSGSSTPSSQLPMTT